MSRGLGPLQRRILETLEPARAAAPKYPGSGHSQAGLPLAVEGTPDAAGWIWHGKSCVRLAPEVYDLRCSLVYLAREAGTRDLPTFRAAFSRAVRGLIKRELLTVLRYGVPLEQVDPVFHRERDLEWDRDGEYFRWHSRQIRFVKR